MLQPDNGSSGSGADCGADVLVQEILRVPENNRCMDCDALCGADPWVSVTHGTVLCIQCAGQHRSLGVHISFVRSLRLDTLKDREFAAMRAGGNNRMSVFLAGASRGVSRNVWLAMPVTLRYHTPVADLYRRRLRAVLDGANLPEELDMSVKPPLPLTSVPPLRMHRGRNCCDCTQS
eukprot:NODE_20493_length_795_cov_8.625749.p1 GENE.NODE_20493_length_795_cov_8.625749~~NODE_20493_length_795_cov_8.625749.p1  ORF type:complete len:177 (-),score=35.92 NODE_20493_length_795_cov_8.625749:185-715(-)